MKEVTLSGGLLLELEDIYEQLEKEYEKVAKTLGFSCEGCPDNCCDSYFLHYTYVEWAYLWEGVKRLDVSKKEELISRAHVYLKACMEAEQKGERPQVMCPLNENGLCVLYKNRLLVCRTHGVPATLCRPDGQTMRFPGCFRCQETVDNTFSGISPGHVERTGPLRRLALLENAFLNNKRHLVPKLKKNIAEMLVSGPPQIPLQHCEK